MTVMQYKDRKNFPLRVLPRIVKGDSWETKTFLLKAAMMSLVSQRHFSLEVFRIDKCVNAFVCLRLQNPLFLEEMQNIQNILCHRNKEPIIFPLYSEGQ